MPDWLIHPNGAALAAFVMATFLTPLVLAFATRHRNVPPDTPPEMEPQHALRLDAHARDRLMDEVKGGQP